MSPANRYAVIGLGMFGEQLARQLAAAGAEVIAVDSRPELVDEFGQAAPEHCRGDAGCGQRLLLDEIMERPGDL